MIMLVSTQLTFSITLLLSDRRSIMLCMATMLLNAFSKQSHGLSQNEREKEKGWGRRGGGGGGEESSCTSMSSPTHRRDQNNNNNNNKRKKDFFLYNSSVVLYSISNLCFIGEGQRDCSTQQW